MARVGPNQDINDPTTILEVGKFFYDKSVDFGILKAISDTENPSASGSPIPTVTIPLKLMDGSTYSLDCSRITDNFTIDEPKLGESVLNTYIDLAERFREYWSTMSNTLSSLNDFFDYSSISVSPHVSGSQTRFGYLTGVSGSFGGRNYTTDSVTFYISVPDIPSWSGYGPINYNYQTYPQLLNTINDTIGSSAYIHEEDIDAVYYWKRTYGTRRTTSPAGLFNMYAASAFDAQRDSPFVGDIGPTRLKLIEIPNVSESDMIINVKATADYYGESLVGDATRSEFVQVRIVSGIGNFNGSGSVELDSTIYQEVHLDIFSGIRTINLSINEDIVIPPHKSAFITMDSIVQSNLATVYGPLNLIGDTLVQIEGVTPVQTHSEISYSVPRP